MGEREQRVTTHENMLWLELARQVSGWTETVQNEELNEMVAARNAVPGGGIGCHCNELGLLPRHLAGIGRDHCHPCTGVRVRRVTGFWNGPLAGLFGPNVSWKLPDVPILLLQSPRRPNWRAARAICDRHRFLDHRRTVDCGMHRRGGGC